VQFFLIYNTYKLKDEHFFLAERQVINDEYSQSIRNDKVFPGGAAIIDKYINSNIHQLEYLHTKAPERFELFKQVLCDSILKELIAKNNIDSLLAELNKKHNFTNPIQYSLTLDLLDVAFESNKYITLYSAHQLYPYLDLGRQNKKGFIIGGNLKNLYLQDRASNITVSSPLAYSYRTSFSLYLDTPDRTIAIIKEMMPTFLLSLGSILAVVILFYITFKNWVRQKKIADMKSDFVNSITHEFNTPLTAIIVANKNLQNGNVIEDKVKIYSLTEVIKRQTHRLQNLVGQVLNVTTMNHLQLDKQPFALHYLLNDILLDYRLKLTDPSICLTLNTDAENDHVMLDVFWLTTMLTNLFDNAIKYNPGPQKNIVVSTYNKNGHIILRVGDNGIGMKKEVLKHSFDKFYREAGQLKDSHGLGLGLYYVKCCVSAHDWKIDVETDPGKGTVFFIFIPLEG
jgi:two-component system phosphate regulon sensor histidine kinase PhoR